MWLNTTKASSGMLFETVMYGGFVTFWTPW